MLSEFLLPRSSLVFTDNSNHSNFCQNGDLSSKISYQFIFLILQFFKYFCRKKAGERNGCFLQLCSWNRSTEMMCGMQKRIFSRSPRHKPKRVHRDGRKLISLPSDDVVLCVLVTKSYKTSNRFAHSFFISSPMFLLDGLLIKSSWSLLPSCLCQYSSAPWRATQKHIYDIISVERKPVQIEGFRNYRANGIGSEGYGGG